MSIEHGPNPEGKEGGGRFRIGVESVANEEHPDRNEDASLVKPRDGLFGVFDGMSQPPGGERAAAVARESISFELHGLPPTLSEQEAEQALRQAILHANQAVLAEQRVGDEPERIGTTASVVLIRQNEHGQRYAVIGNVADSRVWIWHAADSALEQVTTDNCSSATSTDIREKMREQQQRLNHVATPEQPNQLDYPDRLMFGSQLVTGPLGSERADPLILIRQLELSDVILITSDGIHNNLTVSEIAEVLETESGPQPAASTLLNASRERSRDKNHIRAKPDDMTALVVETADSSP